MEVLLRLADAGFILGPVECGERCLWSRCQSPYNQLEASPYNIVPARHWHSHVLATSAAGSRHHLADGTHNGYPSGGCCWEDELDMSKFVLQLPLLSKKRPAVAGVAQAVGNDECGGVLPTSLDFYGRHGGHDAV
jgi:hypothetical protein